MTISPGAYFFYVIEHLLPDIFVEHQVEGSKPSAVLDTIDVVQSTSALTVFQMLALICLISDEIVVSCRNINYGKQYIINSSYLFKES